MTTDKYGFEVSTCGRCGGCGQYSYCQMHGSRCFKCGGSGIVRTKRGAAAYAFYARSLEVELAEIAVGDLIQTHGITVGGSSYSYFAKVVSIGPLKRLGTGTIGNVTTEYFGHAVETENSKYGRSILHAAQDHKVRKGWDADTKAAKMAAALAYQASLTQAGTPAKRRAA